MTFKRLWKMLSLRFTAHTCAGCDHRRIIEGIGPDRCAYTNPNTTGGAPGGSDVCVEWKRRRQSEK